MDGLCRIWQIVTEIIAVPVRFQAGPFAWNGSICFYQLVVFGFCLFVSSSYEGHPTPPV